jgi:hypothetical protein
MLQMVSILVGIVKSFKMFGVNPYVVDLQRIADTDLGPRSEVNGGDGQQIVAGGAQT